MKHLLPDFLWSEIFSIDPTFRLYMSQYVFPFIHGYKVYLKKSIYRPGYNFLIIHENELLCTDDLLTPSFITINHNIAEETIKMYNNYLPLVFPKDIIQRIFEYEF
jgi:hypothetical protein